MLAMGPSGSAERIGADTQCLFRPKGGPRFDRSGKNGTHGACGMSVMPVVTVVTTVSLLSHSGQGVLAFRRDEVAPFEKSRRITHHFAVEEHLRRCSK
jgi:hypothetical protein